MKTVEIAPSILSADFRYLEREVQAAQDAGADRIHCDVMDGAFVSNITFGPLVIQAVRKAVTIPLDVHLMIQDPIRYIDDFCNAGASTLTVHAEACTDLAAAVAKITAHGVRPGVSVNPDVPVDLFVKQLALFDQVLIMTVPAGRGGQTFVMSTVAKIRRTFDEARALNRPVDIEVDGGINEQTAELCAQNGANVFVAGNFVFNSDDYRGRISAIREAAQKGLRTLAA
jgi:ribulose-phosphate 3-epimerase